MSHEIHLEIRKGELNRYLSELAKVFKKETGGRAKAELILVGGGAILANYDFRNMTTDLDAEIRAEASMKEAINRVGDENGLPNGWLNTDFKKTDSYSPKIVQYSRFYRTFRQVLTVRTVQAEHLVAMKLRSGRIYKHDLSDAIGVIMEHKNKGQVLSREMIERAFRELYGDRAEMSEISTKLLDRVFHEAELEDLYRQTNSLEAFYREVLIDFEKEYPDVLTEDNLPEIAESFRNKKKKKLDLER